MRVVEPPPVATCATEGAPAATVQREPDDVGARLEAALAAWRADGDARALRRALAALLGEI